LSIVSYLNSPLPSFSFPSFNNTSSGATINEER
jgi:hypothetical protein